ncbi:hypothetical protein DXG01_015958 [Tephrocybe rancida]|nr:hypothetical protein DXG01_015958 [Tephrocybe rancida]
MHGNKANKPNNTNNTHGPKWALRSNTTIPDVTAASSKDAQRYNKDKDGADPNHHTVDNSDAGITEATASSMGAVGRENSNLGSGHTSVNASKSDKNNNHTQEGGTNASVVMRPISTYANIVLPKAHPTAKSPARNPPEAQAPLADMSPLTAITGFTVASAARRAVPLGGIHFRLKPAHNGNSPQAQMQPASRANITMEAGDRSKAPTTQLHVFANLNTQPETTTEARDGSKVPMTRSKVSTTQSNVSAHSSTETRARSKALTTQQNISAQPTAQHNTSTEASTQSNVSVQPNIQSKTTTKARDHSKASTTQLPISAQATPQLNTILPAQLSITALPTPQLNNTPMNTTNLGSTKTKGLIDAIYGIKSQIQKQTRDLEKTTKAINDTTRTEPNASPQAPIMLTSTLGQQLTPVANQSVSPTITPAKSNTHKRRNAPKALVILRENSEGEDDQGGPRTRVDPACLKLVLRAPSAQQLSVIDDKDVPVSDNESVDSRTDRWTSPPAQELSTNNTFHLNTPPHRGNSPSPAVSPVDLLRDFSSERRATHPFTDNISDTLDVLLDLDEQFDFRNIVEGRTMTGFLKMNEGDSDTTRWLTWQLSGKSTNDIWCEFPEGYKPCGKPEPIERRNSMTPHKGREYIYHCMEDGEMFVYAGPLECGEQDEFDHVTTMHQYNDDHTYQVPVGYRAPHVRLSDFSPKRSDVSNSSGSSFGETVRSRKAEELCRSELHNWTPPDDTADEDAELEQEFEHKAVADGSKTPQRSEKWKGKQRAANTPPDSSSPIAVTIPTFFQLDNESARDHKGGRVPKAMLAELDDFCNEAFKSIHDICNRYNDCLSVVTITKYVFRQLGLGKINSFVVFKEYYAANPGQFKDIGTPTSAKMLKGKEQFMAKATNAYHITFGSLPAEQQLVALDAMQKTLMAQKGEPSSKEILSVTRKAGSELSKAACSWWRLFGLTIFSCIVPDSTDPVVQQGSSMFFGNPAFEDAAKNNPLGACELLDRATTAVKAKRYSDVTNILDTMVKLGDGISNAAPAAKHSSSTQDGWTVISNDAAGNLDTRPAGDEDDVEGEGEWEDNFPTPSALWTTASAVHRQNLKSRAHSQSSSAGPSHRKRAWMAHSQSSERSQCFPSGEHRPQKPKVRKVKAGTRPVSSALWGYLTRKIRGSTYLKAMPWNTFLFWVHENRKVVKRWPVGWRTPGINFHPERPCVEDWPSEYADVEYGTDSYKKLVLVFDSKGNALAHITDADLQEAQYKKKWSEGTSMSRAHSTTAATFKRPMKPLPLQARTSSVAPATTTQASCNPHKRRRTGTESDDEADSKVQEQRMEHHRVENETHQGQGIETELFDDELNEIRDMVVPFHAGLPATTMVHDHANTHAHVRPHAHLPYITVTVIHPHVPPPFLTIPLSLPSVDAHIITTGLPHVERFIIVAATPPPGRFTVITAILLQPMVHGDLTVIIAALPPMHCVAVIIGGVKKGLEAGVVTIGDHTALVEPEGGARTAMRTMNVEGAHIYATIIGAVTIRILITVASIVTR